MVKAVMPRVETRHKTEAALRAVKQIGDARTNMDESKIKENQLNGNYRTPSRNVCWKVPKVVVRNDYFVEVLTTTKPLLKAKKQGKEKDEEEEDQDTLSKGPPVLDMYAEPS